MEDSKRIITSKRRQRPAVAGSQAPTQTRAEQVITVTTGKSEKGESKSESSREIRTNKELETGLNLAIGFVEIKGGVTRNLGNFQSARVDVGVSVPYMFHIDNHPVSRQNISSAYSMASEIVDEMIAEEIKTIDGDQ